jgi:hypothetical protein
MHRQPTAQGSIAQRHTTVMIDALTIFNNRLNKRHPFSQL